MINTISDCFCAIRSRWNATSGRVCFRTEQSNPSSLSAIALSPSNGAKEEGRGPPFEAQPRGNSAIHAIARLLTFALTLTFSLVLTAVESSEPAPLAAKSLLLSLARAGDSLVAVGDHGRVLISRDEGHSWTQSIVPTRAMLTGVSFPDPQHGWAVGHDGVILHTEDGGRTWRRQDPGNDLETIFLDVLFLDAQRGFAVGAYGKFLHTQDGGKSWQAATPSEHDIHYNRLTASPGGKLFLSGESGSLLISSDAGATWQPSSVPYDGSLFGYIPVDEKTGVVHGLRGHIFTTTDQGETWAPQNSDVNALIMGGTRLQSGVIVLGGIGGNIFISRDNGAAFTHWKPANFGGSIAAVIETRDGAILTAGEAGAVRLTLP